MCKFLLDFLRVIDKEEKTTEVGGRGPRGLARLVRLAI